MGEYPLTSKRRFPPNVLYILHNERVRERALILFCHSPPLTDSYIIYEVGMCTALMYIPSAEMQ